MSMPECSHHEHNGKVTYKITECPHFRSVVLGVFLVLLKFQGDNQQQLQGSSRSWLQSFAWPVLILESDSAVN